MNDEDLMDIAIVSNALAQATAGLLLIKELRKGEDKKCQKKKKKN